MQAQQAPQPMQPMQSMQSMPPAPQSFAEPPQQPAQPSMMAPRPAPMMARPMQPAPMQAAPMQSAPAPNMMAPPQAAAPVPAGPLVGEAADCMNALNDCCARLDAAKLSVVDTTKVRDCRLRIQGLHTKLSNNELSAGAVSKLAALCSQLAAQQYAAASQHHLSLISSDWNDNKMWLPGVKTLIQLAQAHNC
jgi:hypothetical protein